MPFSRSHRWGPTLRKHLPFLLLLSFLNPPTLGMHLQTRIDSLRCPPPPRGENSAPSAALHTVTLPGASSGPVSRRVLGPGGPRRPLLCWVRSSCREQQSFPSSRLLSRLMKEGQTSTRYPAAFIRPWNAEATGRFIIYSRNLEKALFPPQSSQQAVRTLLKMMKSGPVTLIKRKCCTLFNK